MTASDPKPAGQRRIAPVYLVREGDLMLDAPLDHAWPLVIDYPTWQNYTTVETVAGTPGQEGEVVLLKKEEHGMNFPPYYARTIKLEPGRRIVWKTYPQAPDPELDYFGIVDFSVAQQGAGTRFHHSTIYEFQVAYEHARELDAFRVARDQGAAAMYASVFPKLKALVEAGRPPHP